MYENILCSILDCGYLDLKLLDSITIDWDDINEELDSMGINKININDILFACFWICKRKACELLDDIKCDISEEESEELEVLDPMEDIESFHNYTDTHVYIIKNSEVYKKYPGFNDIFEELTGFSLQY